MTDEIRPIKMDELDLPEDILRSTLDEENLADLAASIEAVGLLQPIVVKKNGPRFLLIAGFRRTMAHNYLGKKTILATIKPEAYEQKDAVTLAENVQREELPIMDEARSCRQLVDSHGWGIPKTARVLGKSEHWVRGRLDLLRLPPNLAEALTQGQIGMNVALELSRINDEKTRNAFTSYAVMGGCTAEQARRWREQADRDEQAGYLSTTADPENELFPPEELYEMLCQICAHSFDSVRVRIIKACPDCYKAVMALKEGGTANGERP
jgi:ParB/RepB/Spo0J family partition protein